MRTGLPARSVHAASIRLEDAIRPRSTCWCQVLADAPIDATAEEITSSSPAVAGAMNRTPTLTTTT
jgi:hypothetical protein